MIALTEYLLSALLLVGTFFILIGAFGLVKLSDFFKRLHAPTKASTLGVGCVLLASVGYHLFLGVDPQPRELLITVFLFITAPISAHLMAKAALSLMMENRPEVPNHGQTHREAVPQLQGDAGEDGQTEKQHPGPQSEQHQASSEQLFHEPSIENRGDRRDG